MYFLFAIAITVCFCNNFVNCSEYNVEQIHMAQGVDPTSMTISWTTNISSNSYCYHGILPNQLNNFSNGTITSYSFNYYPDYNEYFSPIIHHVTLTNLLPNQVYFYQCGDHNLINEYDDAVSGILSFKTLPRIGNKDPISFAVIGDLGQTDDSKVTVDHILENQKLEMILHAGDMSYADCDQPRWDTWANMVQVLAQERPWMVCAGNHEIEMNADGSHFLAYEQRFRMPAIKPAEFGETTIPAETDYNTGAPYCCSSVYQTEYNYGNSYYSFDAASAHVIFLNPYATSNQTSTQYQWLESDLTAVNREVTPWVIVVMHCPWYSSNMGHYEEEQTVMMRNSMEPLFYNHHVNIVFAGHVHAYERSYPVYDNSTVEDGTVYVTIGDGGNREGHASGYYEQPEWSAYRNGTQYGHGEMILLTPDRMLWRWNRNLDGELVTKDEVHICNTAFGHNAYCD